MRKILTSLLCLALCTATACLAPQESTPAPQTNTTATALTSPPGSITSQVPVLPPVRREWNASFFGVSYLPTSGLFGTSDSPDNYVIPLTAAPVGGVISQVRARVKDPTNTWCYLILFDNADGNFIGPLTNQAVAYSFGSNKSGAFQTLSLMGDAAGNISLPVQSGHSYYVVLTAGDGRSTCTISSLEETYTPAP